MKYLAYLVKRGSSWDFGDDDESYEIKFSEPQYDDFKIVAIEVLEESSSFKDIMGR